MITNITEAQERKLLYNNVAVANMRTPEQIYMIEKKEHENRLRKRQRDIEMRKEKIKNTPKRVWSIKHGCYEDEMTEAQIESDVAEWFDYKK